MISAFLGILLIVAILVIGVGAVIWAACSLLLWKIGNPADAYRIEREPLPILRPTESSQWFARYLGL